MKVYYLLWSLTLGFIILRVKAQGESTTDENQTTPNDATSISTIELSTSAYTTQEPLVTSTTKATQNAQTSTPAPISIITRNTTTTTTRTTTTTTTTTTTKRIPPSNPTWIIVGSLAGGFAFIGLTITGVGLCICCMKSSKKAQTRTQVIPLRISTY
ncbi:unnamed protein product [Rotaria magnacalcarata]|uniref:Uncharacterized protein n=1 Tax=Rotaria magnacalcarata TaxID=392030 RepID=A0A817A316_9BILA|nr:unnamed protein product [Rotaria magnacalcarata]CAF3841186.1 unnamed protein product [Rotaria magnacalcarata]